MDLHENLHHLNRYTRHAVCAYAFSLPTLRYAATGAAAAAAAAAEHLASLEAATTHRYRTADAIDSFTTPSSSSPAMSVSTRAHTCGADGTVSV